MFIVQAVRTPISQVVQIHLQAAHTAEADVQAKIPMKTTEHQHHLTTADRLHVAAVAATVAEAQAPEEAEAMAVEVTEEETQAREEADAVKK